MMAARRLKAQIRESAPRHAAALDILVVDDDPPTRLSLSYALTDAGHKVIEAEDGEEALAKVSERSFDVAILDVRLPKLDGLTVAKRLRVKAPTTSVILMTAFARVPDAVAALRDGAYDYVTKPFDPEELSLRVIGHIAEHRALRQELEEARRLVASRDAGSPIIGYTPSMLQLVERINTAAQSEAPVLICGEAGTGKELVAHTIHARGPRKNGPFVAVNCAAFPETRIEAELFGHERNAFPGALRKNEGRFCAADGGTLFLDEVAALPLSSQANLLRVIDEGVVEPLGDKTRVPVNVRVICGTDADLRANIDAGTFREDLHFRIAVLELLVPPLRERRGDLPLLIAHFLRRFSPRGRVPPGIAPRAWAALHEYSFPGNVRELGHAIERAVVLAQGSEIDLDHLPEDVTGALLSRATKEVFQPLTAATREFEKSYLMRALRLTNGDRAQASELLGVSVENLADKLSEHQLETERGGS